MKPKKKQIQSVRLPRHVLPESYRISLKPDLESFTFSGEETIDISVLKSTKTLVLHAKELEIVTAEVVHLAPKAEKIKRVSSSKSLQVWTSKITYNERAETVTLLFPKSLSSGKAKVRLVFRGVLNDKLRGYYRSSFTHNGVKKHLATTQFEATDARRAFPCFDEPNMKAVFHVSLVVPKAHVAISNTLPAVVREHEAGLKVVSFAPTPRMSTYLLAFISGELESIQKKSKTGVVIRVFTTKGKIKQARFALEFGVKCLEFYEKYFEIKYPLPVLDLIAVPDFMSSAMENWGAITFREVAILIDETHSTVATKQLVGMVIAHEIAHQWFGNLVTMDWWTHLWLNEGFASYMEYVALEKIAPEWQMWTQFVSLDYAAGMSKDELLSTHPIEVEVHHPDEIDEIFDDISYRKGSSVIRMLAEYLGAETFRKGLVKYLKHHAYNNATTKDLWVALEQVSGKPVQKIMNAWTRQAGFPLVSVHDSNGKKYLSQKRYLVNPKLAKKESKRVLWPIPVSVSNGQAGSGSMLLLKQSQVVDEAFTRGKLNTNETGFYRVKYTQVELQNIAKDIASGKLSVLDRWGVISNAWSLCMAGELPAWSVLELCRAYSKETDLTVFSTMLAGLLQLAALHGQEKWHKHLDAFIISLLEPSIKRLGYAKKSGESHGDTLLRGLVLQVAGTHGLEKVVSFALGEFRKLVRNGFGAVPVDIRSAVYGLLAYAGGEPEFQYFKKLYTETELQEEKDRIARAMCGFRQEGLVKKALEFGFSGAVRAQDSWRFCSFVGAHSKSHEVLWKFIKNNWPHILEVYGNGGHLLARVVQSLVQVHEDRIRADFEKFFAAHPKPGAERTLIQTLERVETLVLWRARSRQELARFFAGSKFR